MTKFAQVMLAAVLTVVFLMGAVPAAAQDFPPLELYGGFTFSRVEDVFGDRDNALGFQFEFSRNFNEWFGLVTEFSGVWGDLQTVTGTSPFGETLTQSGTYRQFSVLSGPRFSRRMDRITLFAHALSGFTQQRVKIRVTSATITDPPAQSVEFNAFAAALGGGLDVKVSDLVSWRVVQADYLPTNLVSRWQQNVRATTGIVLTFQ